MHTAFDISDFYLHNIGSFTVNRIDFDFGRFVILMNIQANYGITIIKLKKNVFVCECSSQFHSNTCVDIQTHLRAHISGVLHNSLSPTAHLHKGNSSVRTHSQRLVFHKRPFFEIILLCFEVDDYDYDIVCILRRASMPALLFGYCYDGHFASFIMQITNNKLSH